MKKDGRKDGQKKKEVREFGRGTKYNGAMISKVFKTSLVSMIAAAVAAMLGIVVDGIVIGHFLGPKAMAAYGLATPLVNLANIFSGVLATGGQIICAQRLGAGDAKGARRAFSVCLLAALVISAIVSGVLFLVLSPVYFKAFRLHRRPDDSDAVKTPTAEMMKK